MANMMATIARNGEKMEVKAVEKIVYKNGADFITFIFFIPPNSSAFLF
ncbi:hypothetical protein ACT4UL_04460 [Bacillus sp. HC-TM]